MSDRGVHGIVTMHTLPPEVLRQGLQAAGLPEGFAVVPFHQPVPRALIEEIDAFLEVFERVTTRPRWQRAVSADGPAWARAPRPEVCFFSAWDFHLPHDGPERWRLIEVNDNGSGFLFASILNSTYYRLAGLAAEPRLEPPPSHAALGDHVVAMIAQEARAFFGDHTAGACFILDDPASLAHGHFRVEHELLAALLRARGWEVAIGAPEDLVIRDRELRHHGRAVRFVVNRSTDFFWRGEAFGPLRQAFADGGVYVAPNPFTYLTRSDKRLLEPLSVPDRDAELGIQPDERAVLGERVPETRLVREANVDELARRKHELFFKPAHGYASHGTIASSDLGRSRLRRLVHHAEPYVAQRFVPKGRLQVPGADAEPLSTDLRVWAYRGARYLISGRATASEARRDLARGGWVPTFVCDEPERPA